MSRAAKETSEAPRERPWQIMLTGPSLEQIDAGVVRRITQTDYYVAIRITDAKTGKVLDEQAANFAGGPEGWASGVRMLIKHQILMPLEEP